MYTKLLSIALFTLSILLNPTIANAWDCGKGGLKKVVESLKLEDAQKEKIKSILDSLKPTMMDKEAQMLDLDTQINQQATSATMDQAAVESLIDKKTTLIGDMIKAKMTAKNQIFNILNAQQRTEFQNKMKDLEEKIAAKFKECRQH